MSQPNDNQKCSGHPWYLRPVYFETICAVVSAAVVGGAAWALTGRPADGALCGGWAVAGSVAMSAVRALGFMR